MSPKPRQTLKIHPTPFAPSRLSIPPSPFSPLSPLEIIHARSNPRPHSTYPSASTGWPHPPSPIHWVWTCHQCSRSYGLGVTRRCLDDGHTFCNGTTTIRSWKGRNTKNPRSSSRAGHVKRHRPCGSEFDYQGWKAWGCWRRRAQRDSLYDTDSASSSSSSSLISPASSSSAWSMESSPIGGETKETKNCWRNCDYPSECRWGKQFGVHTPLDDAFPSIITSPVVTKHKRSPPSPEGVLKVENIHSASSSRRSSSSSSKKSESTKPDFWGALLASATRRKSHPPSPLASVSEEPDSESRSESHPPTTVSPQALFRDHDGDVQMTTLESPVTTLKNFIGKKSKRVKRSKESGDRREARRHSASVREEFDAGIRSDDEMRLDEFGFARLERVGSRDSGYHSTSSVSA